MTREEADNILLKAVVGRYPTTYNGADVIQVLLEVFNDKEELEEKLKAKDEEINSLKRDLTALYMLLDDPQDVKARKMCAMLFWEWKKHKQTLKEKRDEENNETPSRDSLAWFWIVAQSEMLFKKAHAMLKATT